MSDALVCLTDTISLYAQELMHDNHTNPKYTACDNSTDRCKSEDNVTASPQDENTYSDLSYSLSNTVYLKQKSNRKREASNILMECVKRRDNLKNIDFYSSNVPSDGEDCNLSLKSNVAEPQNCIFNGKDDPIKMDHSLSSSSICELSLDFSPSTDSGIECLSQDGSPNHSTESIASKSTSEDTVKESMDIDTNEFPSDLNSTENTQNVTSDESLSTPSVAIYEDLNCLHLTDEVALSKFCAEPVLDIKSPIVPSLFNAVSSTIYFSTADEKVGALPSKILALMKWKLSSITPVLIRDIVTKCGFHLIEPDASEEWIGTWGKHLKCSLYKRIKSFQKVNHYPGSFHLGRKDRLWENYWRMRTRHGSEHFNFFPETFVLPADLKSLKKTWEESAAWWIIKPPASARGTGVKVVHKWSQVPKNKPMVVQRYIADPYLINGTKFDLRVYVLVPSVEPLRIYIYEDGLVRFASEKYSLSGKTFGNRFVHLTNYSINKKSALYTVNEDGNSCQGHKWTLKSFWSYMGDRGVDVSGLKEKIVDMVIKTILCSEAAICRLIKTYAKSTYNCFELFGFDIMLDKDLQPWLLEVNISPSLHTRSGLDLGVKGGLVKDMLNMVGFQVPHTPSNDYGVSSPISHKHKSLRCRFLDATERQKHSFYTQFHTDSSILDELTADDVRCLVESEDEFHRRGSFQRVFPGPARYAHYFEHVRYYNLLLDAWERQDRPQGICRLQALCQQRLHLTQ